MTQMTKRKRHSSTEIAAKLEQADDMIGHGKNQAEIARSLGISVMTFHRWRKARPRVVAATGATREAQGAAERGSGQLAQGRVSRIADLQLENARLRQLVTDLLLEKMRLEEELDGGRVDRARAC